jgi:glycosyltransferase involved in cell wall biosynthesis
MKNVNTNPIMPASNHAPGFSTAQPANAARFPAKLLIVSHVVHYNFAGRLHAYAPYAREIEIWAQMFDSIAIAAPCREEPPPADCAPFAAQNLRIIPQRELGGETIAAKLKLIGALPALTLDLCAAMRRADAIHVRCPGNLGLLGALLAPLFSRRLIAKFAGQWSPSPREPLTTRFQRFILRSRWWRGPVTVYGRWPGQPAHVVPFFSAALTDAQVARARAAIASRTPGRLRHILFAGRLSRAKNVDVILAALAKLRLQGVAFTATIAGEGPQLDVLRRQSAILGLTDCVEFPGGVSSDRVIELLERSGILVLASETEGWPKAIVEAMAFGLVAIGSDVGLIPEILGEGRGLMVPPRDADALTAALRDVLTVPERYTAMRARAAEWGARYTVESLGDSLRTVLGQHWRLPSAAGSPVSSSSLVAPGPLSVSPASAVPPAALFVGAFVPGSHGTRGISEDVSIRLASRGWRIATTSRRAGRAARLLDMLRTCWRDRHRYQVAAVDVYSGLAFAWAEAVCWILRKAGKPYVLTLHGGRLPEFSVSQPARVRRLLASAAAVTAPSKYLTGRMRPYRQDVLLIPNAIDVESYPFRMRRGAARRLVWLRAFHEIYNPVLAVRVLARLADEFPEIELTMVGPDKGDGALQKARQEAQKLGVSAHITFTGTVPKQQVPEKLAAADIFLNTSNIDNTPVSVMEAMACGLCIVSTNVGGIPYLLDAENDALLVPKDDVIAMAHAVRRILTDSDLAQRISTLARLSAERFSWSTVAPQWDRLLRSVAESGSTPRKPRKVRVRSHPPLEGSEVAAKIESASSGQMA